MLDTIWPDTDNIMSTNTVQTYNGFLTFASQLIQLQYTRYHLIMYFTHPWTSLPLCGEPFLPQKCLSEGEVFLPALLSNFPYHLRYIQGFRSFLRVFASPASEKKNPKEPVWKWIETIAIRDKFLHRKRKGRWSNWSCSPSHYKVTLLKTDWQTNQLNDWKTERVRQTEAQTRQWTHTGWKTNGQTNSRPIDRWTDRRADRLIRRGTGWPTDGQMYWLTDGHSDTPTGRRVD